jgi:putative two-component system response regulator
MAEYENLYAGTNAQQTVLVVDDTKDNLTIIGELLEPHYRVRLALSGERALKVAQIAPVPDLILLDVMMPDMDGYAVLERLRATPARCDDAGYGRLCCT